MVAPEGGHATYRSLRSSARKTFVFLKKKNNHFFANAHVFRFRFSPNINSQTFQRTAQCTTISQDWNSGVLAVAYPLVRRPCAPATGMWRSTEDAFKAQNAFGITRPGLTQTSSQAAGKLRAIGEQTSSDFKTKQIGIARPVCASVFISYLSDALFTGQLPPSEKQ